MKNILSLLAITALLTACGGNEKETRLEGERISIMELQTSLIVDETDEEVVIPAPWKNAFWPQYGGYPNHSMQHLSLPDDIEQKWRKTIGDGESKAIPMTAQPIIIDGMLYALNSEAMLYAIDIKDGDKVWRRDVSNQDEDDPVITGGIAFSYGRLYVTNGLNEIIALDAKTGEIVWSKKLPSVSQAAPTILDGRIYVPTIDNRLIALSEDDGTILWEYEGILEGTGVIGGVSPAANSEIVVPVFSSGEVAALRVENGSLAWSDNLDSSRNFGGMSSISDIKATPVIDKGLLITKNFIGRMAAIDIRTGNRVWQRDIGGSNTPWVAGDNIFTLSSDNNLIALNRQTGLIYWTQKLDSLDEDVKKPITWHGPVLAGGRLILTSSNNKILEINPQTGEPIRQRFMREPIAMPPIVAGGSLYIVSTEGRIYALR